MQYVGQYIFLRRMHEKHMHTLHIIKFNDGAFLQVLKFFWATVALN